MTGRDVPTPNGAFPDPMRDDGSDDVLPPSLRGAVDALRHTPAGTPDAADRALAAALAAQRAAVASAGRPGRGWAVGRPALAWAAAVLAAVGLGTAVWRAGGAGEGAAPTVAVSRGADATPAAPVSGAAPLTPVAGGTAALDEAPRAVRFTLRAPAARRVALVGAFNRWDPSATPLTRGADGWAVDVALVPGRHAYAFVVDGARWVLDPDAPSERDPDFGRAHSVTVVGVEGVR
jgi:hypothetical protein